MARRPFHLCPNAPPTRSASVYVTLAATWVRRKRNPTGCAWLTHSRPIGGWRRSRGTASAYGPSSPHDAASSTPCIGERLRRGRDVFFAGDRVLRTTRDEGLGRPSARRRRRRPRAADDRLRRPLYNGLRRPIHACRAA